MHIFACRQRCVKHKRVCQPQGGSRRKRGSQSACARSPGGSSLPLEAELASKASHDLNPNDHVSNDGGDCQPVGLAITTCCDDTGRVGQASYNSQWVLSRRRRLTEDILKAPFCLYVWFWLSLIVYGLSSFPPAMKWMGVHVHHACFIFPQHFTDTFRHRAQEVLWSNQLS